MATSLYLVTMVFSVALVYAKGDNGHIKINTDQPAPSSIVSNTDVPASSSLTLLGTMEGRHGEVPTTVDLPSDHGTNRTFPEKMPVDKISGFSTHKTKDLHGMLAEILGVPNNTTGSQNNTKGLPIDTIWSSSNTTESNNNTTDGLKHPQTPRHNTPDLSPTNAVASTIHQEFISPTTSSTPSDVSKATPTSEISPEVDVIQTNTTDGLNTTISEITKPEYKLLRAEVVGTACILLGVVVLLLNIIAALLIERRRRSRKRSQVALLWSPPFSREACNSTLYSWGCDVIHPGKDVNPGSRSSCCSSSSSHGDGGALSNDAFNDMPKSPVCLSPALLMWFKEKGLEVEHAGSLPEP